jgi:hypothetical protein
VTPPTVQFIPAPAAAGYLQEITWTMTGASTATITSSGLEIINPSKTTQLTWSNGQPRFWNGSEADNFGATSGFFASSAACRAWWDNYQGEIRFNGGSWESLGDPVFGSAQLQYLNCSSTTSQTGTAFVSGDIVDIRIWDAT